MAKQSLIQLMKQCTKAPMPGRVQPMLCTAVREIPANDDYLYEIKWDGYRLTAFIDNKKVRLDTRKHKDYTKRYPLIEESLKKLKHKMVLDGEAVVFDENGRPHFNAVQLYNGKRTPITYYVFDIVWLDGYDLSGLPLTQRKKILRAIITDTESVKYSQSFEDGKALYAAMQEHHWEGIVAKRKESEYLQNDRSFQWLKIQVKRVDEFVIVGWAESDKNRSFRSLLIGAHNEEDELVWLGRSGGGYKDEEMPGILKKLSAIEIKKSPCINEVLDTDGAVIHWVKPIYVGRFEYAEMTESGRIRKPAIWKGWDEHKAAKDVQIPLIKKLPAPPKKKKKV
jgi:bifunctional non-homologous end joining protein LigD